MSDLDRAAGLRVVSVSTQQTRSLAAAMAPAAIDDVVNSPSYTLMSEYEGRLTLFHQDLYRLAGTDEVLDGGLLDERQDEGVTLSEWADRLDSELDPSRLSVTIEPAGEDRREIELRGHGDVAARYIAAARRWQETGA